MAGRTVSPQIRLQVVHEVEPGHCRISRSCLEHSLRDSLVRRWVKTNSSMPPCNGAHAERPLTLTPSPGLST